MSKTMGQLLDEYLATELKPGRNISSVYLYTDDYDDAPKMVINTTEQDYDFTQVLYESVDLKQQIADGRVQAKALQDKIRQLEKSKKDIIKAIDLLRGSRE